MNPWAGCSQELLDAPPRCDPCPPRRLLSRDQGRNGMSIVRDARRSIARRLIASVVLLALSTGAAPKAPLVNFPEPSARHRSIARTIWSSGSIHRPGPTITADRPDTARLKVALSSAATRPTTPACAERGAVDRIPPLGRHMAGRSAGAGQPLPFTGTPGAHYQVGPPRDWGSGCCGSFGERVVRGKEALPEAGAERAIVDGAADLGAELELHL